MATSVRYIRRGVRGRSIQNFQWDIIRRQSVVHVSASEVVPGGPSILVGAPEQDWRFNPGSANIWVSNISPHHNNDPGDRGGVTYVLHVDWGTPLDVMVTITVEENFPIEIQN